MTRQQLSAVLSVLAVLLSFAAGFVPLGITTSARSNKYCSGIPFLGGRAITVAGAASSSSSEGSDAPNNSTVQTAEPATVSSSSAAPVLNGKRVLPFKVLTGGLKGHKVAAVYAVINSSYKRGYAGWEQCEYVSTSLDLDATLQEHLEVHGSDRVAHVRALSFLIPSQGAMDEVADEWRNEIKAVGGRILPSFDKEAYVLQALEDAIPYDDEDDDEDEDDEEFMVMRAEALSMARGVQSGGGSGGEGKTSEQPAAAVVSPFDSKQQPASADGGGGEAPLIFSKESVDKVLDEVRPYLISDGGNVSVERVDMATKNVYLKLEGACGSCPSSTVTMQMGIERVLKEKFEGLGEVVRVEAEGEGKPTELTYAAVAAEVDRIKPAIIAMGGVVNIVSVDRSGVVELRYRGAKKVRQGVEMAIMDLEFVNEVKFMSAEEED